MPLNIKPCHLRAARDYVGRYHRHSVPPMGYNRIITYTLASETGASLRASGFTFDGIAGGRAWTGQRRRDYYVAPAERKHRWMKRRVGAMP